MLCFSQHGSAWLRAVSRDYRVDGTAKGRVTTHEPAKPRYQGKEVRTTDGIMLARSSKFYPPEYCPQDTPGRAKLALSRFQSFRLEQSRGYARTIMLRTF